MDPRSLPALHYEVARLNPEHLTESLEDGRVDPLKLTGGPLPLEVAHGSLPDPRAFGEGRLGQSAPQAPLSELQFDRRH